MSEIRARYERDRVLAAQAMIILTVRFGEPSPPQKFAGALR